MSERAKITARTIREMKGRGEKIVSVTAYDYPTARLADEAGVSDPGRGLVGMVVLATSRPSGHHVRDDAPRAAVVRAQPRALVVADLPSPPSRRTRGRGADSARFLKRGPEAVKLEGGRRVLARWKRFSPPTSPCSDTWPHPQSVNAFAATASQGRGKRRRASLLEDALALERAGVFAIVLEGIPRELGADCARALDPDHRIAPVWIATVPCSCCTTIGLSFGRPASSCAATEWGRRSGARWPPSAGRPRGGTYPSPDETYAAAPPADPSRPATAAPADPLAPRPRPPKKTSCES